MIFKVSLRKFAGVTIVLISLGVVSIGQVVSAQVTEIPTKECPIVGGLQVYIDTAQDPIEVSDSFVGVVEVENTDPKYHFGGVRVGLGLYTSQYAAAPVYWTVLSDTYELEPGTVRQISVQSDLAMVPAGTYFVKALIAQGDETALFSQFTADTQSMATLVKRTPREQDVSFELFVNGLKSIGQSIILRSEDALSLSMRSANNDLANEVVQTVLASVVQGIVPKGAAVLTELREPAVLAAQSKQQLELDAALRGDGVYTVYAGMVAADHFTPVTVAVLRVGAVEESVLLPYISAVGLSEYPLTKTSEVVACVDQTVLGATKKQFAKPVQVAFVLSRAEKELSREMIASKDLWDKKYYSFSPEWELADFTLTTELYSGPLLGEAIDDQELQKVAVVEQSFGCEKERTCSSFFGPVTLLHTVAPSVPGKSPWFYAAIVIATSLFAYLFIRRLEPTSYDPDTRVRENELQ